MWCTSHVVVQLHVFLLKKKLSHLLILFDWFVSSQIRRLGALDSTWVTSSSNGLQGHAHPAWLHLYLSTCKLLHLALVLPATRLPQFQMYRWAFVGDESLLCEDGDISTSNRAIQQQVTPNFVPYLSRIYRLLRNKVMNVYSNSFNVSFNYWFFYFFRLRLRKCLLQLPHRV